MSFATVTILAVLITSSSAGLSAEPSTFDDSVKPVGQSTSPKATTSDDSIRPIDPAGISGKGTTFDDTIKPVDPSKPLRAVKGNDAGAAAIDYGMTVELNAKKPDTK